MKKILLIGAACIIIAAPPIPAQTSGAGLNSLPPAKSEEVFFSDIPVSHWAAEKINILAGSKFFYGYADRTFLPEKLLTRAELASILVNVTREKILRPDNPTFSDVMKDRWYYSAVETAKNFFIADPSLGRGIFRPDDFVTRQESAAAIVQARNLMAGGEIPKSPRASFADYDRIGDEYRSSIDLAVTKSLVSGYPDNTFRPGSPLTRAEAASLVYNAFFSENPIDSLVKNGAIAFFEETDEKFTVLAETLEAGFGNWEEVRIYFYVKELPPDGSGEAGPIQVFAKVDPFKYFTFSDVVFKPNPVKTLEYAEKISAEIQRLYPGRRNIVIIGYSDMVFYNTAPEVFGKEYARYLPSEGGWSVERVYAAALNREGRIAASWVEPDKA